MEEAKVTSNEDKPFKVEVTKNTKGYNWVVRVYGDDLAAVKEQVTNLETWAKETYGDKS